MSKCIKLISNLKHPLYLEMPFFHPFSIQRATFFMVHAAWNKFILNLDCLLSIKYSFVAKIICNEIDIIRNQMIHCFPEIKTHLLKLSAAMLSTNYTICRNKTQLHASSNIDTLSGSKLIKNTLLIYNQTHLPLFIRLRFFKH